MELKCNCIGQPHSDVNCFIPCPVHDPRRQVKLLLRSFGMWESVADVAVEKIAALYAAALREGPPHEPFAAEKAFATLVPFVQHGGYQARGSCAVLRGQPCDCGAQAALSALQDAVLRVAREGAPRTRFVEVVGQSGMSYTTEVPVGQEGADAETEKTMAALCAAEQEGVLDLSEPEEGADASTLKCVHPGEPPDVPPLYLSTEDQLLLAKQQVTLANEIAERATEAAREWENLWRKENGLPPLPGDEQARRIMACTHERGYDASGCCFDCHGYNPNFAALRES